MSVQLQTPDLCRNGVEHRACNWLASANSADGYCTACQLNNTIPNLTDESNLALWQTIQFEKNRLVYSLLRFRLPVFSQQVDAETGLAFDFLDSGSNPNSEVLTGHARGLITLDIREADDAHRETIRQAMGEPYRTLLGHFRHESAHYYWDRLVKDSPWLDTVREVFGDERSDYGQALEQHYKTGAPSDWASSYISSYATAHPWEDWAETWAHYIHIVDTLESAAELGLALDPTTGRSITLPTPDEFDPYQDRDFTTLISKWAPVTVALNMLNRSLGQSDAYPFVLSTTITRKLSTVHDVIRGADDWPQRTKMRQRA